MIKIKQCSQLIEKDTILLNAIFLLMLFVYITIIFIPAFVNQGSLLQTDQAMWTSIAYLMNSEIFPSQKSFWGVFTDKAGAGMVLGNTYSINLILPWLLNHIFEASTSIKISLYISALLFLFSFYFLANRFMPKIYAFVCSMVILTPMFDNMVSGMWYNYLSIGFGLIFWLAVENFYNNKNIFAIVVSSISLALAVYSHTVGIILCATIWFSFLVIWILNEKIISINFISFLIIPIVSLLLAWPQVAGIINFGSGNPSADFLNHSFVLTNHMETLRRLFFIRVWGASESNNFVHILMGMNILTVIFLFSIGFYSLIKRNDIRKILPIICLFFVTLVLISRCYNLLNLNFGFLYGLNEYYARFQLFSQIYLVLLSGVGLSFLFGQLSRFKSKRLFLQLIILMLTFSFLSVAVRTPKKIFIDHTYQLGSESNSILNNDAVNLWNWLDENIDGELTRVYVENTYSTLHWNKSENPESYKTHILALINLYTGISQVNAWPFGRINITGVHEFGRGGYLFGKSIDDIELNGEYIKSEMQILNCKFIIAHSNNVKYKLNNIDLLKRVATFGEFSIYENREMKPMWAYKNEDNSKVNFKRHSSVDYELLVSGRKGDVIQISMAYHDNWEASYRSGQIELQNYNGMMQFSLPDNGLQKINLKYIVKNNASPIFLGFLMLLVVIILQYYFRGSRASVQLTKKGSA